MAISTIRRFTTDDDAALNKAAVRFAHRHFPGKGLGCNMQEQPWQNLDFELWARGENWSDTKHLRRLWQACRCRALGVPVRADITVNHGYVGYRVD